MYKALNLTVLLYAPGKSPFPLMNTKSLCKGGLTTEMTALPIQTDLRASIRIRRMILTTLLVTIISFLWTLVILGIVASIGGVFYREGILQKIPATAKEQLKVFDEEQYRLKAQIKQVDDSLATILPEKLYYRGPA